MSYASVRIPIDVSFITFHDDELPVTSITEQRKDEDHQRGGGGAVAENTFVLTTGGFPQELILTTRSSFANVKRIELVLDEAKDIVVERCLAHGAGGSGSPSALSSVGADPMSAPYEVIAERRLTRGDEVSSASLARRAKHAGVVGSVSNGHPQAGKSAGGGVGGGSSDADLKPRKPQVEVLELDPAGAGKGIRAIKLKIMSGYSDFVGIRGVEMYGEPSEQRIAVLESKAEVNM